MQLLALNPEQGCTLGPSFCPFLLLPALPGQQTQVCMAFLEQLVFPTPQLDPTAGLFP